MADTFEILDRMTDGFISVDREWRYTYINRAGAQMAGLAPNDFLGKTLWEMNPGATGTKFQTEYERCNPGKRSGYFY
ncbi:MAG: PAS domain-containing protein [Pyrinomonadaceae bacterium]